MADRNQITKKMIQRKVLLQAMNAAQEAKNQAESTASGNDTSPEGYAEDKVSGTAKEGISTAAYIGGESTAGLYRKKTAVTKPKADTPADFAKQTFSVKREFVQKKILQTKAMENQAEVQTEVSVQPAKPHPLLQKLRKETAIQSAVNKKLAEKASRGITGVNATAVKAIVPKTPALTMKQAVQNRLVYTAKLFLLKIKALLAKALRAAATALLALLGGGGIVLVLALVIGAAAAVIGSPMGILFADESGDPNAIPIAEIVRETNGDFAQALNEIVEAHPECSEVDIQYDYEDGHTWASYWPEVLAVFAVDTNLNGDNDVVVIDEAKKEQIKDTFWEMHQIEYEVETIEMEPGPSEEDEESEDEDTEQEEPPAPTYIYILHISVSSRSVEELAADKLFTTDQLDILHELLSEKMRPMLVSLCGGLPAGDGELLWPLPGYSHISCYFGEPDAFGNAGHKGIDIPAPEGTPILAAHDGTVMVSGWNDSYGNQVMLDDGAGLSTRYAHLNSTAVSAGAFVSAGDVIGYVGTTGDSTGNHLHWEVYVGGIRVDPLGMAG